MADPECIGYKNVNDVFTDKAYIDAVVILAAASGSVEEPALSAVLEIERKGNETIERNAISNLGREIIPALGKIGAMRDFGLLGE